MLHDERLLVYGERLYDSELVFAAATETTPFKAIAWRAVLLALLFGNMIRKTLLGMCAALICLSCTEREWSQVTVYVTADPMIRMQTTDLKIRVTSIKDGIRSLIEGGDQLRSINAENWPYRIGLSPTKDPRESRYRVEIFAVDSSGVAENTLLKVSATSGYIPNASKALVLHFKDPCIGKWRECEAQAGDVTCKVRNGIPLCLDDTVDPSTLPDLPSDNTVLPPDPDVGMQDGGVDAGPQPCESYFDCPDDGIHCTIELCVSGRCETLIDTNPVWSWTCKNAGDELNLCQQSRCAPQDPQSQSDGCVYQSFMNTALCDGFANPNGGICVPGGELLGDSCSDSTICGPDGVCKCYGAADAEDPDIHGPFVCFDGVDNDCNGLGDSDDPMCIGKPDSPFGDCPDNTPENCAAIGDEDCNGFSDCSDPACFGVANCAAVDRETNCNDGNDDGGRIGLKDCSDPTCAGSACGPGSIGQCAPGIPPFSSGNCEGGEEGLCGNGTDDDNDGLADCLDSDCKGEACMMGTQPGVCVFFGDYPGAKGFCGMAQSSEQCLPSGHNGLERFDMDGDGAIGCADPDCQLALCFDDGTFQASCSDRLGGVMVCGDTVNNIEFDCGNGIDDDSDGLVDCQDLSYMGGDYQPDCFDAPCGPTYAGRCLADHTCLGGESGLCEDAIDNDHDGLTDCEDPDCLGSTCFAGTCAGDSKVFHCEALNEPTDCSISAPDADGDGLYGCQDPDCADMPCGTGTCSSAGIALEDRECVGGELSCYDQSDNDFDGLTDCQDPDCANMTCGDGSTGKCSPLGTPLRDRHCIQANEGGNCETGSDEDKDGLTDCEDPDCAGKECFGDTMLSCSPAGTPLEARECAGDEIGCGDGFGDASDGTDCKDPECHGMACANGQGVCESMPTVAVEDRHCIAPYDGSSLDQEFCRNGIDDDGDSLKDCQDPDCFYRVCSLNGGVCSGPGLALDERHCISNFPNGEICDDVTRNDEDADGLINCQDPDCYLQPCNAGGGKCTGAGLPVDDRHCLSFNEDCSDMFGDTDKDGLAGCADPDCYLLPCGFGVCTGANLPVTSRQCVPQ